MGEREAELGKFPSPISRWGPAQLKIISVQLIPVDSVPKIAIGKPALSIILRRT